MTPRFPRLGPKPPASDSRPRGARSGASGSGSARPWWCLVPELGVPRPGRLRGPSVGAGLPGSAPSQRPGLRSQAASARRGGAERPGPRGPVRFSAEPRARLSAGTASPPRGAALTQVFQVRCSLLLAFAGPFPSVHLTADTVPFSSEI